MPKSKYPNHLDTSIEIPVVRDNILEIGSDALNSIRSAIFQIERTLGINPQGAVGNTVADRLNKIVDGNGNILKSALDRASILSGPISDADVSKVAAISESKLNLNFPTQLLQDEISILNSQIDDIILLVNEINGTVSTHINPLAINRHPGTAISISKQVVSPSDDATMSLVDGSSQSIFELLYNAHINYTGSSITDENNSHKAEQIYFDTTGTISAVSDANDVQEVVEDLASSMFNFEVNHQDLFHCNGILRFGKSVDPASTENGVFTHLDLNVGFEKSLFDGHKLSTITIFDSAESIDFDPKRSDLVNIVDGDFERTAQIESITLSSDRSTIERLSVFGHFDEDSSSSAYTSIYRNIHQESTGSGLLSTAGQVADELSAYTVFVSDPNSVSVISSKINPEAFLPSLRYIQISIDDGTPVSIDLYDASEPKQTIDTVVSRINEQAAERALHIRAYRVDVENLSSELAIVHTLPDTESRSHTLEIKRSPIDDAIEPCGFSGIEDKRVVSQFGMNYYIRGMPFSGLKEKLSTIDITFNAGERIIYSSSSSVNFEEAGIFVDDVISILNSDGDDGSYRVTGVRDNQLELDIGQLPSGFSLSSSVAQTNLLCYENNVSLGNFNFDIVSGTFGAMLFDVFMDSDQNIFAAKRLEYDVINFASQSLIEIVDFEGVIEDGAHMQLYVDIMPFVGGLQASLDTLPITGEPVDYVVVNGVHSDIRLRSNRNNIELKILFKDEALIMAYIAANGPITINIYGHSPINEDYNLFISRVGFGNFKGRVIGGHGESATRAISKVSHGTIGVKDIGTEVKHKLLEQPIHELRSNGVIYGLDVGTYDGGFLVIDRVTPYGDAFFSFNLKRGVAYVAGKRFEFESQTIITDIPSDGSIDKFFIFIDEYGNIRFEKADPDCGSPVGDSEVCMLSEVEDDGVTAKGIDIRLLIGTVDELVLNAITVSPQDGMGHFKDIGSALKYAKRFSEIYPNAGTPTVHLKSGTHKMVIDMGVDSADYTDEIMYQKSSDYGTLINFPVNITGEGYSTVVDIMKVFNDALEENDDRASAFGNNKFGFIILAPGTTTLPNGNANVLDRGTVSFSNFRTRLSSIQVENGLLNDDDGNRLNWNINVDSVVFDNSEKESYIYDDNAAFLQRPNEIDAFSDPVGNISITNSQFFCSSIFLNHDANYLNNISILNNAFRGSGDGRIDVSQDIFLSTLQGTLTGCDGAPKENKINIFGNINADHNDVNVNTQIEQGVSWTDRSGSDMVIKGDLTVCGGISMGGIDSEAIQWPMYRKRSYFFNHRLDPQLLDVPMINLEKDNVWVWNSLRGSEPSFGSGVVYFNEEIKTSYDDILPSESDSGDPIHVKHLWPAVAVWDPRDSGDFINGANVELPILITLPRGETLVRAEIYRKNQDWPELLGNTCEITVKIKKFSAGLRTAESWLYKEQPYEVVDSDSVTLTRSGSLGGSGSGVTLVLSDHWERLTFDLNVENDSEGIYLHDKYLMTFSVEYPDHPEDASYSGGYQIFYKAHTVSQINSLQGALGLHSES